MSETEQGGDPGTGDSEAGVGDSAPDMPVIDDFESLVDLVIAHEQVFVRYSRGPRTDGPTSRDYEAEVELPGLSVTNLTPEPWWSRPSADWIARRVCKYADLSDGRPQQRPWALLGRVVGNGPDHEPLVVDVRGLGWIGPRAVRQAQERYRHTFKAGRGSNEAEQEENGEKETADKKEDAEH